MHPSPLSEMVEICIKLPSHVEAIINKSREAFSAFQNSNAYKLLLYLFQSNEIHATEVNHKFKKEVVFLSFF